MTSAPDHYLDLTKDLRDLAHLAADDDGTDELLRRGLDWLGRIAPYDLATVFRLRGDLLVAQAARGRLASRGIVGHTLRLHEFPTIREAIETRRARAYSEHDHSHGDGDPFDGVLDLPPGHSCMVVPLCASSEPLGVMTLDRSRCETYAQPIVDLAEVYGQILALALRNAEQRTRLERLREADRERARLLEAELGDHRGILESSKSPKMRALAWQAAQVAQADTPVLILGETGTGKERLARALHHESARRSAPFVKINCAAIPSGLLESELFGHVKGAFTGATHDRAGRFQMANGGTLLLDEIGELPIDLQAKLLRVLQEGTFEPVGSDRTVKVDVRVLAATHVDLEQAIRARTFREDLYYRLSVFPLRVPPLRERLEDLPALCEVLLAEQAQRTGRSGMRVTGDGLGKLRGYGWPGNVRELANVLERATILARSRDLGPDVLDLPGADDTAGPDLDASRPPAPDTIAPLDEVQRAHIRRALAATSGRIYGDGGAAALLGLKPSTLQSRMKKLHITRPGSRTPHPST